MFSYLPVCILVHSPPEPMMVPVVCWFGLLSFVRHCPGSAFFCHLLLWSLQYFHFQVTGSAERGRRLPCSLPCSRPIHWSGIGRFHASVVCAVLWLRLLPPPIIPLEQHLIDQFCVPALLFCFGLLAVERGAGEGRGGGNIKTRIMLIAHRSGTDVNFSRCNLIVTPRSLV